MFDACGVASRAALDEMNKVGVIVGVTHPGWQMILEAAQQSGKPIVASLTTCGEILPPIRSKPDEVMWAIVDTDGYAGMCCIPASCGATEIAKRCWIHRTRGPKVWSGVNGHPNRRGVRRVIHRGREP